MQNKALHIISFDNPFPPKYGGIIEVFYKIKALHALDYTIYLHCFVDEVPTDKHVLNQWVSEVNYYKNKKSIWRFLSLEPYSVSYRESEALLENLKKKKAPVLFEGLKTTSLLKKGHFLENSILRLHNIEHNYFFGIAKNETHWFLKFLFYIEGYKYKNYESVIEKFDALSTLSLKETNYISQKFKNATYIPLFHGNDTVEQLSEFGEYAIYNGDLRTADNRKAVLFLIEIFKEIKEYQLIITASDQQEWVQKRIESVNNILFIQLDDFQHLKSLLSKAHINIMASFQESGTKLKVINALYNSRHCLVNQNMIDDPMILDLCHVAITKEDFIKKIEVLRRKPYLEFEKRKAVLEDRLNDKKNAEALIALIESIHK